MELGDDVKLDMLNYVDTLEDYIRLKSKFNISNNAIIDATHEEINNILKEFSPVELLFLIRQLPKRYTLYHREVEEPDFPTDSMQRAWEKKGYTQYEDVPILKGTKDEVLKYLKSLISEAESDDEKDKARNRYNTYKNDWKKGNFEIEDDDYSITQNY